MGDFCLRFALKKSLCTCREASQSHAAGATFSAFAHTTAERKGSCEMNGRLVLCLLAADAALIATINNDYAG